MDISHPILRKRTIAATICAVVVFLLSTSATFTHSYYLFQYPSFLPLGQSAQSLTIRYWSNRLTYVAVNYPSPSDNSWPSDKPTAQSTVGGSYSFAVMTWLASWPLLYVYFKFWRTKGQLNFHGNRVVLLIMAVINVFTLICVAVLTGVPSAFQKDNATPGCQIICPGFSGRFVFTLGNRVYEWGPGPSWILMVVAWPFAIAVPALILWKRPVGAPAATIYQPNTSRQFTTPAPVSDASSARGNLTLSPAAVPPSVGNFGAATSPAANKRFSARFGVFGASASPQPAAAPAPLSSPSQQPPPPPMSSPAPSYASSSAPAASAPPAMPSIPSANRLPKPALAPAPAADIEAPAVGTVQARLAALQRLNQA